MLLIQMPIDSNQLKQRISEVLEAKAELKRLTSKIYTQLNMEEKYAIRYHIIVLAESLGGICLQIAIDEFKMKPGSFAECFKIMEEKEICKGCAKELIAIVRLRNILTHRYWVIDDGQVYDSIKNNFQGVDKFLRSAKERYAINL